MSIFSQEKVDFLKQPMFFGHDPNIARYDIQKYAIFEKLTEDQQGFFWRPTEVDLQKDTRDFKKMPYAQQQIFTKNLKYQILLDSVQGRAPNIAFLPFISIPELEECVITWTFFELIHSKSYTHIIRNLYANPGVEFDSILDDSMIIKRASSVTQQYDEFIQYAHAYKLAKESPHSGLDKHFSLSEYELKKKLYKTLITVYALEGIRFFVSFACSFAFAELDIMEGNAKIIELIARDENKHLAIVQNILKFMPQDEEIYVDIINDTRKEAVDLILEVTDQEKAWADYLFKDGSMIGLNAAVLHEYVEYITDKRLRTIGFKPLFNKVQNPLSWTNKYLKSSTKQVAPQETEITQYVVGAINPTIDESDFDGFSL